MAELFTFRPDFGVSKSAKPTIRKAQFGDGYAQTARFGINNISETWTLNFTNRPLAEADQIEAFFVANSGTVPFEWQPPGLVTTQLFRAVDWSRTASKPGLYDLTVTFERAYEPV